MDSHSTGIPSRFLSRLWQLLDDSYIFIVKTIAILKELPKITIILSVFVHFITIQFGFPFSEEVYSQIGLKQAES